jgi:hypothetical protein
MQEYIRLSKDLSKIKTTWLLSRDLVKQAKQYALDHDTNVTAIVNEALRDFLSRKAKK